MGSFRTKSKPLAWVTKWIMVLFVDMERTERGGLFRRKILHIYDRNTCETSKWRGLGGELCMGLKLGKV